MKIKTNELTGLALDWAVAKCEGRCTDMLPIDDDQPYGESFWVLEGNTDYMYSTRWNAGGPIIDRMKLNRLTTNTWGGYTASVKVTLINTDDDEYMVWTHGSGPTPLIAAMRCYVASKLGDEVDVPEELV